MNDVVQCRRNGNRYEEELRLTKQFVQDFNETPVIKLGDMTTDAVLICVSIQYVQRPEKLFREISRVLRPGGVVIISISDRTFFSRVNERNDGLLS